MTAGLGLTVLLCAIGAVTIITDHDARTRATAEILRLRHEAELAAARAHGEAARADEERQRAEDEAIKAGDMAAEAEQSAQEAADAMAELARSEREIREFFENATVGLHWAGPDGIIQRVNRAELEMLGYTQSEYVGRHAADFHVDREVMEDVLRRVCAGEVVVNREAPRFGARTAASRTCCSTAADIGKASSSFTPAASPGTSRSGRRSRSGCARSSASSRWAGWQAAWPTR